MPSAPFSLSPLPYAFAALEPHIDAQTMEIHHDKHHAGYVDNLNKALDGHEWQGAELETILTNVTAEQAAIRNNAGGHYNHTLFWETLSAEPSEASAELQSAIEAAFGGMEKFKEEFATAAKSRFGSGWTWLIKSADGSLKVTSTPNQDNPLMQNLVPSTEQGTPILGLDVWEHAYYLKYQNKRADYITAWWNVVNWGQVSKRFA